MGPPKCVVGPSHGSGIRPRRNLPARRYARFHFRRCFRHDARAGQSSGCVNFAFRPRTHNLRLRILPRKAVQYAATKSARL